MSFASMQLKNFRCFKFFKIEKLKQINLIYGPNDSGKTSFLEAIFSLSGDSPESIVRLDLFRGIQFSEKDVLINFFYDFKDDSKIQLCSIDDSGEFCKISLGKFDKREKSIIKNTENEDIKRLNILYECTYNKDRYYIVKEEKKDRTKLKYVKVEDYFSKKLTFGQMLSSHISCSALVDSLDYVIKNKRKDELLNIIRCIDNRIQDIVLQKNNQIALDIGRSSYIRLELFGEGIKRILSYVLGVFRLKNGVLLIDEIENGLFHTDYKKVFHVLRYYAYKNNVQLFIVTHTQECVREFKKVCQQEDYLNEFRIFGLREIGKGDFDVVDV